MVVYAAKELHFNRSGEALKRMQAGVDKLASVVGVTLGPKVCSTIPALLQISDIRQALSKLSHRTTELTLWHTASKAYFSIHHGHQWITPLFPLICCLTMERLRVYVQGEAGCREGMWSWSPNLGRPGLSMMV